MTYIDLIVIICNILNLHRSLIFSSTANFSLIYKVCPLIIGAVGLSPRQKKTTPPLFHLQSNTIYTLCTRGGRRLSLRFSPRRRKIPAKDRGRGGVGWCGGPVDGGEVIEKRAHNAAYGGKIRPVYKKQLSTFR